MISSRAHLPILVLLILVLVWVAAAGISADSIWYDEYLSLFYAGAMADSPTLPIDVVNRIIERESGQAPLYFILLSAWGHLAGWTAFSARMLSLFVGLLAVAWVYRVGADMHSPFAGLCAAIIMAASALFNYYLHEIRMYSLIVLAVSIVLWLYWQLLNTRRSQSRRVAFVLLTAAALYTHAFMIVMIAALSLYHLVLARRTRSWSGLLLLLLVVGALFSPWALIIISKITSKSTPSDFDFLRTNGELLIDLAKAFSNGFWILLLLPLLSLKFLRADRGILLLWWLCLIFVITLLLVNHNSRAINQLRYFLHILPMFALLGGITCAYLKRHRKTVILVLAAWCVSGIITTPAFGNILHIPGEAIVFHLGFPFRQITETVRRSAGENDAIAFEFPYHSWALQGVIDYYMKDSDARYMLTDALGKAQEREEKRKLFGEFLGGAGRVYFVVDRTIERSEFLTEYERTLSERYEQCGRLWDDEQAAIDKYAKISALCEPSAQPLFRFGSSATLVDFVHETTAESHFFYSTWSAELPADTYSFSLRLWDSRGSLLYQADDRLPIGEFNYRIDHVPLAMLPAGDTVRVEGLIYNWRSGERLRTEEGADTIMLAAIDT